MYVVFVSSLGSTTPFPRKSSLSQLTCDFVIASTWKTTEHNATCKVAHGDVNAHHALEFGQSMVKCFRKSWYSSFYDTFSKPMVTIVLCGRMVYDQEIIYERVIVMMASNRSVAIDTCMITDFVFQ